MEQLIKMVKKIVRLMLQSSYTVVLTGPGVSEGSIALDLNNADERIWTMLDPDEFTIQRYKGDPSSYYDLGAPFFSTLNQIKPGEAHEALASLEKAGLIKTVITENIDGLHFLAGSKKVIEIHGTLRSASCGKCERKIALEDLITDADQELFSPVCPDCGELLKPDLIFESDLSNTEYTKALEETRRAELMIIIGPGSQWSPDDQLSCECKNIVVINETPTVFDRKAAVVINDNPAKVINLLMEELKKENQIK
ncbi:MAG: Sir2 family NAD-dependent protein deacetylase [Bacillota bacterium]|nr:Sir2 family NAD-dependent protein deacetylase [Bacillota bacterium]